MSTSRRRSSASTNSRHARRAEPGSSCRICGSPSGPSSAPRAIDSVSPVGSMRSSISAWRATGSSTASHGGSSRGSVRYGMEAERDRHRDIAGRHHRQRRPSASRRRPTRCTARRCGNGNAATYSGTARSRARRSAPALGVRSPSSTGWPASSPWIAVPVAASRCAIGESGSSDDVLPTELELPRAQAVRPRVQQRQREGRAAGSCRPAGRVPWYRSSSPSWRSELPIIPTSGTNVASKPLGVGDGDLVWHAQALLVARRRACATLDANRYFAGRWRCR